MNQDEDMIPHPARQPGEPEGGGGTIRSPEPARTRGRAVPLLTRSPQATLPDSPLPDEPQQPTEAETQLRAAGVRQDVARTLRDRPAAQVARVIAQARARPGVRDLAAWVVSALRALPPEEPVANERPPRLSDLPILLHPGLTGAQRQRWLTRFRTADPADRPAILARFRAEHPLEAPA